MNKGIAILSLKTIENRIKILKFEQEKAATGMIGFVHWENAFSQILVLKVDGFNPPPSLPILVSTHCTKVQCYFIPQ